MGTDRFLEPIPPLRPLPPTKAVMMPIAVVRAFTGRDPVAKCEGAYHGPDDDVQVSFNAEPDGWGPSGEPASMRPGGGSPKRRVLGALVLPRFDPETTGRPVARFKTERALHALARDPE